LSGDLQGAAQRVFGLTAADENKAFEHVFQKLSFEGLEVGNPSLGMNVLKHLRRYMAFGEQALYVAPADTVPQISSAKP
jgi:hypothetical protein